MNISNITGKFGITRLLILSGLIVYLLMLIKSAWLCDDAYITFRTVDNFINGYGLRWNIAERVQTYTHPLWMFLISIFYFFTKEAFYTSLLISITLTLFTLYILLFRISGNSLTSVFILIPILLSKSFLDFSTSGLENPLSHFLLVIFSLVYLRGENLKNRKLILGFLTALILLNRMDFIFILITLIIPEIYKNSKKDIISFSIGFIPFVVWELFSLWYYGFPFPNTAYAKLSTGIPRLVLIKEGLYYFKESFLLDPVTLVVIFVSLFILIIKRNKKLFPIGLGIIFYLGYIVFIGGDFMAGRFLTAPFVLSLVILSFIDFRRVLIKISIIILFLITGLISLNNTIQSFKPWEQDTLSNTLTVVDERRFYYGDSNLWDTFKGIQMPKHNWVDLGRKIQRDKIKYLLTNNIGFQGYYAGPECFLLDKLGLSDPLLSKLPTKKGWRIGHYPRNIPDGYMESIVSNKILIEDKDLNFYYKKLLILTREDLFDSDRLVEIIKFNLGSYQHLLGNYITRTKNYLNK